MTEREQQLVLLLAVGVLVWLLFQDPPTVRLAVERAISVIFD